MKPKLHSYWGKIPLILKDFIKAVGFDPQLIYVRRDMCTDFQHRKTRQVSPWQLGRKKWIDHPLEVFQEAKWKKNQNFNFPLYYKLFNITFTFMTTIHSGTIHFVSKFGILPLWHWFLHQLLIVFKGSMWLLYLDFRRPVIWFMVKETLGRANAFTLFIPNQYFGIIVDIMNNTFLSKIPLQMDTIPLLLDFLPW